MIGTYKIISTRRPKPFNLTLFASSVIRETGDSNFNVFLENNGFCTSSFSNSNFISSTLLAKINPKNIKIAYTEGKASKMTSVLSIDINGVFTSVTKEFNNKK